MSSYQVGAAQYSVRSAQCAVLSAQCITYPAPDGASSVGGTPTTDRYCGATQLQASTTATETTVYTTRQPYQVTPVILVMLFIY